MPTVPIFKLQAVKSPAHHFYLYNINELIKTFKKLFLFWVYQQREEKGIVLPTTLNNYTYPKELELVSHAYTDDSQFCLSTLLLSNHQIAYHAFQLKHYAGILNSTQPTQNLLSLPLWLASAHYSPLSSVFPVLVDDLPSVMESVFSLPVPLQVREFHDLILYRIQLFFSNPIATILVVVTDLSAGLLK